MGKSGESINTTHQQKKLDEEDLLYYRDRFGFLLLINKLKILNITSQVKILKK